MNRILKILKLDKEGYMTTKEKIIRILMGILIAISVITCKKETSSEPQTNTVNSESKPDTQTTNSDNKTYKYVIAKSGLKLREATDTRSKVLTTIPFNTQVEVIGEQEGEEVTKGKSNLWFQISYDGIEGFAYGEFLSDLSNLVKIPDYLIGEYLETTPKDTSCRSDMSSTLYIREGIIICVLGETGQVLSTCIPEKIVEESSKVKMNCLKNPNETTVKKLLGSPIAGVDLQFLPVPNEYILEIKSPSLLNASCHSNGSVEFLSKVEYLKLPLCQNYNDFIP